MLLVVAVLLLGLLPALARAEAPPPVLRVRCEGGGAVVPTDYLGLSLEWSTIEPWFGRSATDIEPSTVALLRGLGTGVLRVGGNSQDGYRFNPAGRSTSNTAFRGTITPGMVDALLEVARLSGWTVVLGLNLKADEPAEAALLTAYAASRDSAGRLAAVQIGNEPDAYFRTDTLAYTQRVSEYADLLQVNPLTRALPLVGPDISNNVSLEYVTAFRRRFGDQAAYLGFHAYGNRPSVRYLLADDVQRQWLARIASVQDAAGGLPVRMDEGNSVGNGGLDKVSNVLGGSAWLASTLLNGAQAGLAGYNVHSWDGQPYPSDRRKSFYTPFVVRDGVASPRSPYYALALLRDLPGTQLCETASALGDLRTWATQDRTTGVQRVYVVRTGTRGAAQTLRVAAPGRAEQALLRTVADPNGCQGGSTALNGARLTVDGQLQDRPQQVPSAADGTVAVSLRPCESAVLELAPR